MQSIGLVSVATYLPQKVRTNAWWPTETIERWHAARSSAGPPPLPEPTTPAMHAILARLVQQAADPFHGVVERRVADDHETAHELERQAAERAIAIAEARGGFRRDDIGALLTHSAVPDYLMSNPAAALHAALGLPRRCLSLQADAASHSFMAQLTLAEHILASGRARYVLLVQSSAASRVLGDDNPLAPMFGDGAAAVLVGRVAHGGVLANVQHTNGQWPRALIASVPGARWFDPGALALHSADPRGAYEVFLRTVDFARDVVGEALREAAVDAADVDFFAVHQGTPWLRTLAQDVLGLTRARAIDTFANTGYLFGVSIPLVLETAERAGHIARGDHVVLYGGGVGATYGAIVLRWGAPVT